MDGVERRFFERVKRALVVGYGGLFEACAARSHISEVTVLDLFYPYRQGEIEARLNTLRRLHPKRRFRATDSLDRIGDSFSYDLVAISGSTLCTGTLDDILQSVDSSAFIILQGQSASVHPGRLFSRGVDMVETSVKPFDLIELADPSAGDVDRFRATMEGGLPLVTFLPRI
jgi:hypothetical protein